MKKVLSLICIIVVLSCKKDSSSKSSNIETDETPSDKIYKDKELEAALYEGFFVTNNTGFDIAIKNNMMYLLKTNASETDKSTNFFLDVIPQNGPLQNFDLSTSEIAFNDSLSSNYSNVAIYRIALPKVSGEYEIIIGQYDNSGRLWTSRIRSNMLDQNINNYKNEYVKNTITNRYLKEFELALKQGYFMLQPTGYDLLVNKNLIYFIKPIQVGVDLDARFYLHIKFDNTEEKMILDFNGRDYTVNQLLGQKYENFTVIRKVIPVEKRIIEIGAGQFNNKGRTWGVVYDLERLYDNITYLYDNQYRDFLGTK
ncbi:hypothetical protein OE09_0031 [Flavobacteriaceae bacterium MAR_2010_72]|nr:hypothetical protein OE09_0031 [Flavobacteriaceae bacterium MAR_2010_72]TVZ58265.1 hypothetical protein NA63_0761 [Flavobacteriaceae bacterium MAR_2010_105]